MHLGLSIVSLQWLWGAGESETPWQGTLFLINGLLFHGQSLEMSDVFHCCTMCKIEEDFRVSKQATRVCRSLLSNAVSLGMDAHANNIPLSYKIKAGYEHHPSR